MSILSLDNYIASVKQRLTFIKTASRTVVSAMPFSLFDLAGNPSTGNLSIGNTANGLVPTDISVAGYPTLNAFGGGATGYISKIEFGSSVACRIQLYDRLFNAGSYAYSAGTTTLNTQPSYASRVPHADYKGLEIWIEVQTAFVTGNNWQVQITYTDQDGNPGHTSIISAVMAVANLTLGRMFQIGLASGDTGVQKIESVIVTNGSTAMTAGAFNVLVLRPLWTGRVMAVCDGDNHDLLRTGLVQVYDTSALFPVIYADSTSSGTPEMSIEIANL